MNELRQISPVLADISNQDVYQTPRGYFDTLADQLMNRIKTAQFSHAKELPFTVPTGYFEGFAEKMISRIKAGEATSASEELEIISPFLSRIDKKMPFSTPGGYFTELADNLAAELGAIEFVNENQDNPYPVLNSLKDKNVYETPAGYFDGLAGSVLASIKQSQQAKVIPFAKKRTWLKYAAAAVVIGVIGTASLLFFHKPVSPNNSDPVQGLSMISDQEMINYLEVQSTPSVSADASNSIASIDINENDARDLLSDVPDDELQQYVDEHVSSKDLITN